MSVSFNDLKRSSANSFEKLNQELSKLNQNPAATSNGRDDRVWSCQTDKAGNGYAVIRFLPAPQGEDVPFVRMFTHGFKGPGGWYIENSLTTIGQQDPVSELNARLWNSGVESDKEIVRKQKRQLNYYSNIYVVKDPANPENEGKVFLFRYGKKIFDKLNDLMNPQFEDEEPVNPFDFWAGANFKLKIRKADGYSNYDKSEFESPGPLGDDDELERIWKSQYSLTEVVSTKNFKSYDALKAKLDKVLGHAPAIATPKPKVTESAPWDDDDTPAAPPPQLKAKEAPAQRVTATDEEDDDFAFFKKLADED
jgi:hypothetical protein